MTTPPKDQDGHLPEPPHTLHLVPGSGDPRAEARHPARWSRPHVPLVVIASGKGGVGKSTLAANLAVARRRKAKVKP